MEGRGDRQQHAALDAALARQLNRALDRRLGAADHDLPGRVVVGGRADRTRLLRRGLGDRRRRLEIGAEQRRHGAFADRHRLLHGAPAPLQEPRGVAERQRAGRGQRRIFAERMPGHERDPVGDPHAALALDHPHHRQAHRHQRRLGVLGQGQLQLRPLEHQPRQPLLQRLVDLLERLARRRKGFRQRPPHADGLRPLPRKHEGRAHACDIPARRKAASHSGGGGAVKRGVRGAIGRRSIVAACSPAFRRTTDGRPHESRPRHSVPISPSPRLAAAGADGHVELTRIPVERELPVLAACQHGQRQCRPPASALPCRQSRRGAPAGGRRRRVAIGHAPSYSGPAGFMMAGE